MSVVCKIRFPSIKAKYGVLGTAPLVLVLVACCSSKHDESKQLEGTRVTFSETRQLSIGTLKVDKHTGTVILNEREKELVVIVAIPKRWEDPEIEAERFEAWLLLSGGGSAALLERPTPGILPEAGTIGSTANARFTFRRQADLPAVKAVVIRRDDQFFAYPVKG